MKFVATEKNKEVSLVEGLNYLSKNKSNKLYSDGLDQNEYIYYDLTKGFCYEDELDELMDLIYDDFFDNSVVSDYFLDVPLAFDLKEMFYNDFVKIGEKEKEILEREKTNFYKLNYEMFYARFYKNEEN